MVSTVSNNPEIAWRGAWASPVVKHPQDDQLVSQCCQCRRTKTETGWELRLVEPFRIVSHGYCPVCLEKAMAEFHAERAARLDVLA